MTWVPATRRGKLLMFLLMLILSGFLIPQRTTMPVTGATPSDWHPRSYWHHPWGESVAHKGIDIFAPEGRPVVSTTDGLVVSLGSGGRGGNRVLVLGPRWRFHYYAHLSAIETKPFRPVAAGERLGTVGTSGNASGKPPHLHYVIFTAVPYPWRVRWLPLGWQRMFYLDPNQTLR